MLIVKDAFHKILEFTPKINSIYRKRNESINYVLSEPIKADRDLPAFDRVTMDGIAIKFDDYKNGLRTYEIIGTQGAGEKPLSVASGECVKIMTGASLGKTMDTIIPVEQLEINNHAATINDRAVRKQQFIHPKGSDAVKGQILIEPNQIITPEIMTVMASVGKKSVKVTRPLSAIIISTGDELVDPDHNVLDFQIRRSNDTAICAMLQRHNIQPQLCHLPDNMSAIKNSLRKIVPQYDLIIVCGGVSKGEYDYVWKALQELNVKKHFHGVKQKPGKPLWFGTLADSTIFALPGNPVSSHMCTVRYIEPWIKKSYGLEIPEVRAILDKDVAINTGLTNFILVNIKTDKSGHISARPVSNNNSGDFVSLLKANAYLELTEVKAKHKKGSIYRVWPFRNEVF